MSLVLGLLWKDGPVLIARCDASALVHRPERLREPVVVQVELAADDCPPRRIDVGRDLQANAFAGTAAQGIFLKSTSGGTTGKIINYVDQDGQTLFALLPDGSLLLPPVAVRPAGSDAGLKLCNFGWVLGVVDSSGNFTALT